MSHRFHAHLRAVTPRARTERPVIANSWEAVYFDHSLERIAELADAAAEVGVERFVLDDGWFLGRRDDTAGLGDWTRRPRRSGRRASAPLVEHVKGRGMEFGLWVEPEMVNLDSETARHHPERVLRGRSAVPPEWRQQQVLDLQDDGAYADLRDALIALLDELDIAYLKWDHNRDLTDVTHDGRPAVHGQTLAAYRLLDELRDAHPDLEIESCASGGGRVDADVLSRTDRIWPSDTIDPLERQHLQRWTSLLVPPELMGSHVGGPTSHTTKRTHTLRYRAATALLHWFGIEWDVVAPRRGLAGRAARLGRAAQAGAARSSAPGRSCTPTTPTRPSWSPGSSRADRSEAWYVVATVAATETQHPARLRLTGLDPDRTYRLTEELPPAAGRRPEPDLVGRRRRAHRPRARDRRGGRCPCSTRRRRGCCAWWPRPESGLRWSTWTPTPGTSATPPASSCGRASPTSSWRASSPTCPPGTAVDLAAGEGRNAIWLASRGWSATAVDFSQVALDKGARLADGPLARGGRHLGARRRHDLAGTGPGRPGRDGLLPGAGRGPTARGAQRGGDAASRRDAAARRPRLDQPHRGHRRSAGPRGADDRRRRARRPGRHRRRGGARRARGPRGQPADEHGGEERRTAWDCLVRVVRR